MFQLDNAPNQAPHLSLNAEELGASRALNMDISQTVAYFLVGAKPDGAEHQHTPMALGASPGEY